MTATSIAVSTLRHGPELVAALRSVADQAPAGTELVLVRSGVPRDAPIPDDLASWLAVTHLTVRVAVEPCPGASLARQRALEAASGDVVVFIDDDVVALPGWFSAMSAAMAPGDVGGAGGTILPRWPHDHPPAWLHRRLVTYYGERRAGPQVGHRPFGANLGLRRAAVLAVGGLRPDLGHRGERPGLHDETDLCERVAAAGYRVVEVPEAVVLHTVRPEQMRLRWALRRAWHEGRSDAARDGSPRRRDQTVRAAKLAALLGAWPFSVLAPRTGVYVTARVLSNLAYLRESLRRPPPEGSG